MTVAKKIISTLLVAAVAVGIGLVLALLLPQGEYPPPDPTHTEMADTTIHTGRLPGYENAPQNTTPEYFGISLMAAWLWGRMAACRCCWKTPQAMNV